MSNFETLGLVTEGLPGTAPQIFVGSTVDSLGTITAVGYLNDISAKVKLNDVFYINYSDTSTFPLNTGESSTFAQFTVSYSTPNWSLVQVSGGLGQSLATVSLTAAQFNGMYAAPVALVSAQGVNKLTVVDRMELVMTFGSADFAAGGVVAAQYDSTVHGAGVLATNTEAAADFFAGASNSFLFSGANGALPFTTTVNKGIYLSNATQAFTTGDSTFVAKVYYHVIATA